jgi:hypothetical protein
MTPNMTYGSPMPAQSKKVAYTSAAGTTAALPSNTEVVRVVSTTDCFIEIGTSPTAVADTGMYLAALVPEYFSCPPSGKVSAIQVASDGTIYVTPFA